MSECPHSRTRYFFYFDPLIILFCWSFNYYDDSTQILSDFNFRFWSRFSMIISVLVFSQEPWKKQFMFFTRLLYFSFSFFQNCVKWRHGTYQKVPNLGLFWRRKEWSYYCTVSGPWVQNQSFKRSRKLMYLSHRLDLVGNSIFTSAYLHCLQRPSLTVLTFLTI